VLSRGLKEESTCALELAKGIVYLYAFDEPKGESTCAVLSLQ